MKENINQSVEKSILKKKRVSTYDMNMLKSNFLENNRFYNFLIGMIDKWNVE